MDMTVNKALFRPKSRALNPVEIEAFAARIEAIRADILSDLGEKDAAYIYKVRDMVRNTEFAGRGLLMFAGWLPPVWLIGSVLLGISKIIDNMELGHNVMHGQFDWMNDPSLNGLTYDWDNVSAAVDWKDAHNYLHHTFTNIIGKDRDVGYQAIRVTREQPWRFEDLFNLPKTVVMALLFEWAVGVHGFRWEEVDEHVTEADRNKRTAPFLKKAKRQILKDYVFFPVISGINFIPVLTGNMTANVIRNVWAFAIIFCGHFAADTEFFENDIENETRGQWYLRQIRGSSNISGTDMLHYLSGNLSHQIEHHVFPTMPANRYKEVAPKLKALCKEYGQNYDTGTFAQQFSEVIIRLALHSLPNPIADKLTQATATLNNFRQKGINLFKQRRA